MRSELNQVVCVKSCFDERLQIVDFRVIMIVADLVAKASMLEMFHFNAVSYGCHLCKAEGFAIDGASGYYPSDQEFELRDKHFHQRVSALAERMNRDRTKTEYHNISGYKGVSAFENIVDGLPLSAGVDYMHCILIGVFPNLFKTLNKKNNKRIRIL